MRRRLARKLLAVVNRGAERSPVYSSNQCFCAVGLILAAAAPPVNGALAAEINLIATQVNGASVGMGYKQARGRLLKAGFVGAASTHDAQRCGFRPEICRAYPEADACSDTGMGFCRFEFGQRGSQRAIVITSGETVEDLTVHRIFKEK